MDSNYQQSIERDCNQYAVEYLDLPKEFTGKRIRITVIEEGKDVP